MPKVPEIRVRIQSECPSALVVFRSIHYPYGPVPGRVRTKETENQLSKPYGCVVTYFEKSSPKDLILIRVLTNVFYLDIESLNFTGYFVVSFVNTRKSTL